MTIESVWEIGEDQFDSPHKVAALVEDLWRDEETKCVAFDLAEGLHWHCADYHGGQWSDRYRIMCGLKFNPGCSSSPDTEAGQYVYDLLSQGS